MIFVTVGSRKYPFNRLFKKLDDLFEDGSLSEEVFAQIGTSTYVPKHFEYIDFLSEDDFNKKIIDSDIVISHGASGSIMKALKAGKKIIAVSRLEKYGEHINDHQIQNNEAFSSNGYVLMADLDLDNLGDCVLKIHEGTDRLKPWKNKDPMALVNMIDRFIEGHWQN